jgi:hypothetical protein
MLWNHQTVMIQLHTCIRYRFKTSSHRQYSMLEAVGGKTSACLTGFLEWFNGKQLLRLSFKTSRRIVYRQQSRNSKIGEG